MTDCGRHRPGHRRAQRPRHARSYWAATLRGPERDRADHPVRRRHRTRHGWPARSPDFDAGGAPAEPAASPQTDRMTQLALAAADWALADARRRPGVTCRSSSWAWSPRARPAASSSASGSCRSSGARAQARQRLPVLRLVLRGQHRPDLDPARHARPERRARHRAGRRARRARAGPAADPRRAAADRGHRRHGRVAVPVGLGRADGQRPAEHRATTRPAPTCRSTPRAGGYVPGEGGAILIMEDAATARSRGAPGSTARSPGTRATFDPPPGHRPRARPAPGHRAPRWPTPGSRPATSTWCSPTPPACPS